MKRVGENGKTEPAGETFERLIKRGAGTFTAAAGQLNLHEATLRRYARGASTPSRKTVHLIERWLCATLGDVYPPGTMGELWYPGWNAPTSSQPSEGPSESVVLAADHIEDPSVDGGEQPARSTPTGRSRSKTTFRLAVIGSLLALMLTGGALFLTRDKPNPRRNGQASVTRTIQIYNKVTSGTQMREDSIAFLSTKPVNYCKRDGCVVEGTDILATGAKVTAVCQTLGARNTNGEDSNPIDDDNPELFESRLWYGVRWPDGRFGFFSEVWVHPSDRGGLGLPLC